MRRNSGSSSPALNPSAAPSPSASALLSSSHSRSYRGPHSDTAPPRGLSARCWQIDVCALGGQAEAAGSKDRSRNPPDLRESEPSPVAATPPGCRQRGPPPRRSPGPPPSTRRASRQRYPAAALPPRKRALARSLYVSLLVRLVAGSWPRATQCCGKTGSPWSRRSARSAIADGWLYQDRYRPARLPRLRPGFLVPPLSDRPAAVSHFASCCRVTHPRRARDLHTSSCLARSSAKDSRAI